MGELKAAKSGGQAMSKDLEVFLEREIADLEDELECPVCLEVAKVAPIYKCEDDHLICRQCRPKLKECPQCRAALQGSYRRFRGAEKQSEKLKKLVEEKL